MFKMSSLNFFSEDLYESKSTIDRLPILTPFSLSILARERKTHGGTWQLKWTKKKENV